MKLEDLKNAIKFDFDFADNKIDTSFYIELQDIKQKYAKQIKVIEINKNFVICDFCDFILRNKEDIIKYICSGYKEDEKYIKNYIYGIFEEENDNEQAGWIYAFMNQDLEDFLTK